MSLTTFWSSRCFSSLLLALRSYASLSSSSWSLASYTTLPLGRQGSNKSVQKSSRAHKASNPVRFSNL